MKIKCRPEDFFVEEEIDLQPGKRGRFGLYLLEKKGLSTLEAIGELARRLGRPAKAISAGGLKDKYAHTRQHVTVAGKPVGRVRLKRLKLEPLGRVEEPVTGRNLVANRFTIVLRDLPPGASAAVAARAQLAARQGLPNYFDEQRFGSLRPGEGFIARRLIERDFEGGLRLHLAAPSRRDASRERARRRQVGKLWGQWDRVFEALPRGNERSVVGYLRDHPGKFARAFDLIEPRLARLYLFAYQSYVWNGILAGLLARLPGAGALFEVPYAAGALRFFGEVGEGALDPLDGLAIPLPHPRADYGAGPLAEAAREAFAAEEITPQEFRLRGSRKLRFRAGERPALMVPRGLGVGGEKPDELYPGQSKLRLDFALPPGSYATLLVKFAGRELLPGSRASRRRGRR